MDAHEEIERTMLDMKQGRIAGLREAAEILEKYAGKWRYIEAVGCIAEIRARADELERGE